MRFILKPFIIVCGKVNQIPHAQAFDLELQTWWLPANWAWLHMYGLNYSSEVLHMA